MTETGTKESTLREALFSGEMDLDGTGGLLALYRGLFKLRQSGPGPERQPKSLTENEISMRLAEGFILLEMKDLSPADSEFSVHCKDVAEVLACHSENPGSVRAAINRLLKDPVRLTGLVDAYMAGGDGALREQTRSLDEVNTEIVMFVVFNALKGLFLSAAHRLAHVRTEKWHHGRCPICGGGPAVSFLAGEGGKRFLICHRCETAWRFRRLACPFCENDSPGGSKFLYIEEPAYRMMTGYVCDECRCYIKTWRVEDDELGALCPEVEDLKTPAFDAAMESEGYRRGAPNIFGVLVGTVSQEGASE